MARKQEVLFILILVMGIEQRDRVGVGIKPRHKPVWFNQDKTPFKVYVVMTLIVAGECPRSLRYIGAANVSRIFGFQVHKNSFCLPRAILICFQWLCLR